MIHYLPQQFSRRRVDGGAPFMLDHVPGSGVPQYPPDEHDTTMDTTLTYPLADYSCEPQQMVIPAWASGPGEMDDRRVGAVPGRQRRHRRYSGPDQLPQPAHDATLPLTEPDVEPGGADEYRYHICTNCYTGDVTSHRCRVRRQS